MKRPRFSLRTLVLGVLLVASGATLWWNWGPWEVGYTIHADGEIQYAQFSEDDRIVQVRYKTDSNSGGTANQKYSIFSTERTGNSNDRFMEKFHLVG